MTFISSPPRGMSHRQRGSRAAFVLVSFLAICVTRASVGAVNGVRRLAGPKKKERMQDDIDLRAASRVLDTMLLPQTPEWNAEVKRIVMNRQNPQLPPSFPKAAYKTQQATQRLKYQYPKEDLPTNYATCAVVGNAGMMLSTEWGPDIDAHDVVIRLNDGPTGNWSKHVGSKTTVRILNNYWTRRYMWYPKPPDVEEDNLMLFSLRLLGSLAKMKAKYSSKTRSVLYMAPELSINARSCYGKTYDALKEQGIIKVFGRNTAPTGIKGIFMAMHMCKHTSLYGFDVHGTEGYPYHYFDNFKGTPGTHSFKFQSLFLKMLEEKGKLDLCLSPQSSKWCKLSTCNSCVKTSAQELL